MISVIVAVYNVKEYLENCIESIIKQTYNNIEIILIDDGSYDGSEKICVRYADIDSRIKVIHHRQQILYNLQSLFLSPPFSFRKNM